MNNKSVGFLVMVGILGAAISPLYSQNAGFQLGQSRPAQNTEFQNPQTTSGPILIAPMASPIEPTGNPVLPLSGTIPRSQSSSSATELSRRLGTGAITILPGG